MYRSRKLLRHSLAIVLTLGMTMQVKAFTTANLLTDPGWNTPLTNPLTSYLNVLGPPYTQDTWGDENSAVVAAQSGISPLEGNGMLRMNDDGLTVTQIWQRVSVSSFATQIDAGLTTADLSGWFNVPAGVSAAASRVRIGFINSSNSEISGVTVTEATIGGIDSDPNTWQQISNLGSSIPVGTRILEAQFMYVNSTMQGQPGYVDAADMRLTVIPEPTAIALALFSSILILPLSSRSMRTCVRNA